MRNSYPIFKYFSFIMMADYIYLPVRRKKKHLRQGRSMRKVYAFVPVKNRRIIAKESRVFICNIFLQLIQFVLADVFIIIGTYLLQLNVFHDLKLSFCTYKHFR